MTIDGETYALELPFLVVATQNPIEYEGTYPLPEAQLDRFSALLSLGYPPLAEEARMLAEQTTDPPLDHLEQPCRREDVLVAIEAARVVYVEESVGRYVVAAAPPYAPELEARARGEPARRNRAAAHGEGARGRARPGLRPAGGRAGGRGRRALPPGHRRARGAGRGSSAARRRCRRR